jgi:hypothetical protein
MIVTKEEAETKLCHKTLKAGKANTLGTPCIVQNCMAWRWFTDKDGVKKGFCGLAHGARE